MKSPLTGKEMTVCSRPETVIFRKEEFEIQFFYYKCENSGEQFTDDALEELNDTQLYNCYRTKYNLPFPDQIRDVRQRYGLSATKMAEILGFGVNVYRNYEDGEVPSESNGRLIQMASDAGEFARLVRLTSALNQEQKDRILSHIHNLIAIENTAASVEDFLLGSTNPNEYTGFRSANLIKYVEMIAFFAEKSRPFKTKLNKLLFYADFLHYKRTGYSISGVQYLAIQFGPVPNHFDSIFDYAHGCGKVQVELQEQSDSIKQKFLPEPTNPFNSKLFTESELNAMEDVRKQLTHLSSSVLSKLSHEEEAWISHEKSKSTISYKTAFSLKGVR